MTLWLDQVLASPTIGVVMEPWMGFQPGIWGALEQLQEKWRTDGNGNISIQTQAVDVTVSRDSGLYLKLTPNQIICGMRYNLSLVDRPGALPELSIPQTELKFSKMQQTVLSTLRDLFGVTGGPKQRHLVRLGHLVECRLVKGAAPPGVAELLHHFEEAWPSSLKSSEANFLTELSVGEITRDQCHHFVSFNDYDRPDDLTFRLDWQRIWLPAASMRGTELLSTLDLAVDAASKYFQEFGEGGANQ